MLAVAALLLFAISIIWFRNRGTGTAEPVVTASVPQSTTAWADDDAQVLSMVQKKSPALAATYRENLDAVNTYIRDARRTVQEDPSDMGARDHLLRAYDEKALLYAMALERSEE